MIHVILFVIVLLFLAALFEFVENRMRREQRERIKFMLDHKSAKEVLHRQKYFCKCGKRKRISEIVCKECYREEKENMPGL